MTRWNRPGLTEDGDGRAWLVLSEVPGLRAEP
jgi:hypothetical protein